MLPPFELLQPATLADALAALAEGGVPLAGGTNIFPDIRFRGQADGRLVALGLIEELRRIDHSKDRVTIGGRTTISDLLDDPKMADAAPSLVAAARLFGGAMVRNVATVGGNICYGSPAADTVPPLLSLDAEVTLTGAGGERTMALDDFLIDYRKTALAPGEILKSVSWTPPAANAANLFYKLGLRKGDAITVVGIAVTVAAEDGICTVAQIALGAVAPRVLRATDAERMLAGQALSAELIEAAARSAVEISRPIDDVRASADYRRHTTGVLVARLLSQAWEEVGP